MLYQLSYTRNWLRYTGTPSVNRRSVYPYKEQRRAGSLPCAVLLTPGTSNHSDSITARCDAVRCMVGAAYRPEMVSGRGGRT